MLNQICFFDCFFFSVAIIVVRDDAFDLMSMWILNLCYRPNMHVLIDLINW